MARKGKQFGKKTVAAKLEWFIENRQFNAAVGLLHHHGGLSEVEARRQVEKRRLDDEVLELVESGKLDEAAGLLHRRRGVDRESARRFVSELAEEPEPMRKARERPSETEQVKAPLERRETQKPDSRPVVEPPPEPSSDPDTLLGPCQITEKIGQGGMGRIFKAWHKNLRHYVAVKTLHPQLLTSDQQLARFRREARLYAKVDHPNFVRVFDRGEKDGAHYIIMELVRGLPVDQLVEEKGPRSVEESRQIALGVARGLGAAHARGIVHRDVKPANLLIGSDGQPKVVDLGIAKPLGGDPDSVESTIGILGTPRYMAPEQWKQSAKIVPATDVWALGATIYFLLLGKHARTGTSVLELLRESLDRFPSIPAMPFTRLRKLARIVKKCTRRDPSARYSDATELAEELERL